MQYFQKYISLIDSSINRLNFNLPPKTLYEPIRYALTLGGKRLRPLFVLLAFKIFSTRLRNAINPALSVELFHNFTLLHDDIMDQSPLRRCKPTVYSKWDVPTAILAGDRMLIKVYEMLDGFPNEKKNKVIRLFNRCAARVCEGQQLDMDYQTIPAVSTKEYIGMIRLKTAELFGYCAALGAIIAGAKDEDCRNLYLFGINIGISFQILDDVLDTYGDKNATGKEIGGDICRNKKTFLLARAYEKAGKNLFHLLKKTEMCGVHEPQTKISEVKRIFNSLNVLTDATHEIERYRHKALKYLYKVKKAKTRLASFIKLSDFITNRNY